MILYKYITQIYFFVSLFDKIPKQKCIVCSHRKKKMSLCKDRTQQGWLSRAIDEYYSSTFKLPSIKELYYYILIECNKKGEERMYKIFNDLESIRLIKKPKLPCEINFVIRFNSTKKDKLFIKQKQKPHTFIYMKDKTKAIKYKINTQTVYLNSERKGEMIDQFTEQRVVNVINWLLAVYDYVQQTQINMVKTVKMAIE